MITLMKQSKMKYKLMPLISKNNNINNTNKILLTTFQKMMILVNFNKTKLQNNNKIIIMSRICLITWRRTKRQVESHRKLKNSKI